MAVLAAVSSMSACIIPVAPDFQDPPNQPDSVPALHTTVNTPAFNSITSLTSATATFQVNASDPDPEATLSYQFVFDYPPNAFGMPRLGNSASMLPVPASLSQDVTCQRVDNTQQSRTHQLTLYVTTGSFDTSNPSVFGTATDASAVVVTDGWTIQFQMACPQ
ncbi:MAG TPA: hypothetical protein VGP64_02935 [Polyangia bacterium]